MGMFLIECFRCGHSKRQKTKCQIIKHMSGAFPSNADVVRSSYYTFCSLQTTLTYTICFVGHLSINQSLELLGRSLPYPGSGPQWLAMEKW